MEAGIRGHRGSRGLVKHKSDVLDAPVVCAGVDVCVIELGSDMIMLDILTGNSCRGRIVFEVRAGEEGVAKPKVAKDDDADMMRKVVDVSLMTLIAVALSVKGNTEDMPGNLSWVCCRVRSIPAEVESDSQHQMMLSYQGGSEAHVRSGGPKNGKPNIPL